MAHGINANLVHTWRKLERDGALKVPEAARFVPVVIEPDAEAPPEKPDFVDIELQRGAMTVKVRWPASSTSELAAWMRELLR